MTLACLAIDIGGTKLACGVVGDSGEILMRGQVATPQGSSESQLFETLISLVETVLRDSPVTPEFCGVGCGGPMVISAGTVSPLNIPCWVDFPLVEVLQDRLALPVALENDAKALALGEGWLGAARGSDSYMAMVVSTGVGGGIVLDGRLLDGGQGNAGHIGHLVVVPDGRTCGCGVKGCLEAEVSGTAIMAITGKHPSEADPATIQRSGHLVGQAVASVASLLDLNLCVVAGSVALGFGTPFFEAAQESLEQHTGLSFTNGARIIPAGLGADGPLVGAAAVGFRARSADQAKMVR
ncbi:MAG: ROK family protein [Actinomycetes bacterium]